MMKTLDGAFKEKGLWKINYVSLKSGTIQCNQRLCESEILIGQQMHTL